MKIHNIKNGLKKASAVALATLSVCPSMNAAGHREHEEESSSIVSNVASAIVGGATVGIAWVLTHFFGGKKTGETANTKFTIPEELEALYKKYDEKAEQENEKAVIDAIYNYLKYSFENAFVKLEKVDKKIDDTEFNKIFEKSAEYRYFGKLELVDQGKLKEHFKDSYGNKEHSKGYVCQLGYADGFLVEAVAPCLNCEPAKEFVEKLLKASKYNNGHMFREDISDWFSHWEKNAK